MKPGDLVQCYCMLYKGLGVVLKKTLEVDANGYHDVLGADGRIWVVPLHSMRLVDDLR